MDIRSAMTELVKVEEGLSITEPLTSKISKVCKWFPPQGVSIAANLPAWTNDMTLTSHVLGVSGQQTLVYTVHAQLYVGEGDQDVLADMAASYLTAFITAMNLKSSLNDPAGAATVTDHTIRGGNPTLVSLSRANRAFTGLDLFIDLRMIQGVTVS
jgi:hypothetical protein